MTASIGFVIPLGRCFPSTELSGLNSLVAHLDGQTAARVIFDAYNMIMITITVSGTTIKVVVDHSWY